jgi:hypothetical protein
VIAAAALGAFTVLGLLWGRPGRDPLYWLITLLIVLRASIAQASIEIWRAARRWFDAMPAAVDRSRRECLGGSDAGM